MRLFFFKKKDEELSKTQRHLDMSGLPMPNFMNIGHSLRLELNETDDKENDDKRLQRESVSFDLKTPDLIIEEEESDMDSVVEMDSEEG